MGSLDTNYFAHICDGTILSENYILTSATCSKLVGVMARQFQRFNILSSSAEIVTVVKTGKFNSSKSNDAEQVSGIEKHYRHKLRNKMYLNSDYNILHEKNRWYVHF